MGVDCIEQRTTLCHPLQRTKIEAGTLPGHGYKEKEKFRSLRSIV
jgi:hypothetical protein